MTGRHLDHAREAIRLLLANPDPVPRRPRLPVQRYDQAAVELLIMCWSVLKTSIPLKTWQEWNDTLPDFVQIDLGGHEGGAPRHTPT